VNANADPRILLVNNPSNPTGQVFSPAVLEVVTSFCKDKGIILISDEIYSDLCYDPSAIKSSAFTSTPKNDGTVIMTGGLSKVSFSTIPPKL
jgi:aspartate/methionine/tyrosine aminotransferase